MFYLWYYTWYAVLYAVQNISTIQYVVLYAVLSELVFSKFQPGSVLLLALTNDGIIILTNAGLSACVKLNHCLHYYVHVSNSIIPTITLA